MVWDANIYKNEFQFYSQWLRENSADVVVCDFISSACFDAAYETGNPFVITVHMLGTFG
jgi:hypothetical protein